jgi:hypothetical protein
MAMAAAPAPGAAQQQMPPAAPYGSYGAPAASAAYQQPKAAPPAPQAASYGAPKAGGYGSTQPLPASSYGGAGMANNRPVMRDDTAGGAIMPINAINPYSSR